jgi:putative ABC transport system substrate-binding protein
MDRRAFLTAVAGLLVTPLAAEAQQTGKVWRIGLVGLDSAEAAGHTALRQALRALGYEEGKNLAIEYRGVEGRYDRLPEVTAELLRLNIDVLVTNGTPGARAAKHVTTTVPVVVAIIGDAVAGGIVPSLARPGGNITGTQFHFPELMAKRIQLLREALPRVVRVGVFIHSANPSWPPALNAMEQTARVLGIQLDRFEVLRPDDFDRVLGEMTRQRVEAFIVADDSMLRSHGKTIADLAVRRRLPSFGDREYARDGGLLAYAVNRDEVWRRAAVPIDKIIKGSKPGELPFQQVDRFDLVINLKTAKALGLTIPPSLLLRADQVIQ